MTRTIPEIGHLAVISPTVPEFGGRAEEFQSALDEYLVAYAAHQRPRHSPRRSGATIVWALRAMLRTATAR